MSCRISIADGITATTFCLTKEEEANILAIEPNQLQPIEEEFVSVFPTSPVAALCDAFRSLDRTHFENALNGRTIIRIYNPNGQFSGECPSFVSELFGDTTKSGKVEGPHMVFVIDGRWPQKPRLMVWISTDDLCAKPEGALRLLFRGLAQARYEMERFCGVPSRDWENRQEG